MILTRYASKRGWGQNLGQQLDPRSVEPSKAKIPHKLPSSNCKLDKQIFQQLSNNWGPFKLPTSKFRELEARPCRGSPIRCQCSLH